jgi:hypothetical protein
MIARGLGLSFQPSFMGESAGSLKKDLEHISAGIRAKAYRFILSKGAADKLKLLEQALDRETDLQLRYELLGGLKKYKYALQQEEKSGDDSVLSDLRKQLSSGDAGLVRKACHGAVHKGLRDLLPDMISLSRENPDPLIRCAILRLLAMNRDGAEEKVCEYLSDKDPLVQATALDTLFSLSENRAVMEALDFISCVHERVRAVVVRILSAAFSFFEENLYSGDRAAQLRIRNGLSFLAENGQKRAKELLLTSPVSVESGKLSSKVEENPASAAVAVGMDYSEDELKMQSLDNMSDEEAEAELQEVVGRLRLETDPEQIARGLLSLKKVFGHGKLKMRMLMMFLVHESGAVRASALEVLQGVIPEEHKDFYVAFLEDDDAEIARKAILALGSYETGVDEYFEYINKALRKLLFHEKKENNFAALECLSILMHESLLPLLEEALYGDLPEVSEWAAEIMECWYDSPEAQSIIVDFRNRESGGNVSNEDEDPFSLALTPAEGLEELN